MENPLVSIIVPVYRAEKYLRQCVDSILAQTFTDWECILVDDGSPDRSGEICDEYACKDSRIKVVHQLNGGVNVARKNGFSYATGEFVMFVDSDDTLTPRALEVLLSQSEGQDLVSGSVLIYRNGSNIPEPLPIHIQEVGEYDGRTFLTQLFEAKRFCSVVRQLIRRSILSEEILSVSPNVVFSEDFIINLRIGLKIKHAKGVKDVVYEYNYHQGSAVTSFQMTSDYMDEYDTELLKSLSAEQQKMYDRLLYCYRLNKITEFVGTKDIHKTQMAASLRSECKGKQLPLRSQYYLLLLYVPSCKLRSVLLKLYGLLAGWIVKILKYVKG